MSDLPKSIHIYEQGPREGFQFEKGLERAIASGRFDTTGSISLTASEAFVKRNQKRTLEENYEAQHGMIEMYKRHGVPIDKGSIMAAFGCNFEGDISIERVLNMTEQIFDLAEERELTIRMLSPADTMAWATPGAIKIGGALEALREKAGAVA